MRRRLQQALDGDHCFAVPQTLVRMVDEDGCIS